jgi:hypothetical protein
MCALLVLDCWMWEGLRGLHITWCIMHVLSKLRKTFYCLWSYVTLIGFNSEFQLWFSNSSGCWWHCLVILHVLWHLTGDDYGPCTCGEAVLQKFRCAGRAASTWLMTSPYPVFDSGLSFSENHGLWEKGWKFFMSGAIFFEISLEE